MARKTDSKLTPRQMDELGKALRDKRTELRARQVVLDEQRIVEVEPDMMDTATDATAGAEGDALSAHDMYLLTEIDGALTRLREGRYGLSEESSEPIAYARLRLIPWARRTAEEEEERAPEKQATRSSFS